MGDPVTIAALVVGTVISASSSIRQGKQQNAAARLEADQLEKEGLRAYAQGTREQNEQLRQGRILASNMRAQMAGSGGTTDDPGATEMIAKVGRDAEYNALAAMYDAKSRHRGYGFQAKVSRWGGRNAKQAGRLKATGTVLSGYSAYKGI